MRIVVLMALLVIILSAGYASASLSEGFSKDERTTIVCVSGCYHDYPGKAEADFVSANIMAGYEPAYAGLIVLAVFIVVYIGSRNPASPSYKNSVKEAMTSIREEAFRKPAFQREKMKVTRKQRVIRNVRNLEMI